MIVEKQYERTESWADFIRQWEGNNSEAVAIGLLYAASQLEEDECFWSKVSFYLDLTHSPNSRIMSLARQLVVKHLLRESLPLSWSGKIGQSHTQLLEFLAQPLKKDDELRKAPYPRFVATFLFHAFDKWNVLVNGADMTDPSDLAYASLGEEFGASSTPLLVSAAANWGLLGSLIASKRLSAKALDLLKGERQRIWEMLAKSETERAATLFHSIGSVLNVNPPASIAEENARRVQLSNALFVLYLDNAVPQ